jgi:multisubunit Na+/H+ antiporter MnhB subunit
MKRMGVALLLIGVWAVFLARLPLEYGNPVSEVAEYYLTHCEEDTGARNVVAAVLADYRLYDTVGEATVLFTAILGVTLILGRNHHRTEQKMKQLKKLYGGSPDGDVYHL